MATDERDVIHLSDREVGLNPVLLVPFAKDVLEVVSTSSKASSQSSDARRANPRRSDPAIDAIVDGAARQHHVSADLIRSVIATESAYGVRAVSQRGAMGLMQLMPATARELGVTDAFDPQQNVEAGARHLRRLLDRFGDDTTLALAAYNAGIAAVERYGFRVPPFAETASYVPRVLSHLRSMTATTPAGPTRPTP